MNDKLTVLFELRQPRRICSHYCNDLKNFINKTALNNLENQYAAIKTIR